MVKLINKYKKCLYGKMHKYSNCIQHEGEDSMHAALVGVC